MGKKDAVINKRNKETFMVQTHWHSGCQEVNSGGPKNSYLYISFYCSKENYLDWPHNMPGHTHNSLKVCIFDQTAHWSGILCGRSRARTRVIAKAISPSNTVRSNGLSHVGAGHSLTTVQTLWWKGLALLQVSAWRKLWEKPFSKGFTKCWRISFNLAVRNWPWLYIYK